LGSKGGGDGIRVKGAGGELLVEAGEVIDEAFADAADSPSGGRGALAL